MSGKTKMKNDLSSEDAEKIWKFLLRRADRECPGLRIRTARVGKDMWQISGHRGPIVADVSFVSKKPDNCMTSFVHEEVFYVDDGKIACPVTADLRSSKTDILKKLVENAKKGDVRCGTIDIAVIKRGESLEELLVKADLEDVLDISVQKV